MYINNLASYFTSATWFANYSSYILYVHGMCKVIMSSYSACFDTAVSIHMQACVCKLMVMYI